MIRFSARLIKSGFGATASTMPRDLIITPESWSASDRGGNKQATLSASGSAESLAFLCGWLGDKLEIYNDAGDAVWWGVLWDIEVSLGNIVVNLSLDSIYNRVKVIYPFVLADGSMESRSTLWAEDANSVSHYGVRELLYGMPESFAQTAWDARTQLLNRFKNASPIISTQQARQLGARLTGRGMWYRAESIYFTNADGLLEHTDENAVQVIGQYKTSTAISFGTLTPGGEADEMHIAVGNFDPLTTGDTFTVTGAAVGANNDTYTIEGQDASNQIAISGTFAAEAAGATVKLSLGDSQALDNVAQAFQLVTAWTATHVAVKVRKVGNPTDNFRIGIYPDSAGIPGTVLAANETLGSTLFTELTWTEFELDVPVALAATPTFYWLGIRRTGAASLDDGYEIALDEDLGYIGGNFIHYNGAAWVSRVPDADMPFRIIGETSSTEQLETVLDTIDEFGSVIMQVESAIPVRGYIAEDNPRIALEEIDSMLDAGTATGERLIAWMTQDASVVVGTAPASSDMNLVLGEDGKLRYPNGSGYVPGRLVYGQHVNMDTILLLDAVGIRAAAGPAVYIAESEYDAASDQLSLQSEGALDPFQALTLRQG